MLTSVLLTSMHQASGALSAGQGWIVRVFMILIVAYISIICIALLRLCRAFDRGGKDIEN
jgi:CHASE3 domain sensor protein